MSFLHLHARSLWQTIKQSIRQWMKPDNYSTVLNATLDLFRLIWRRKSKAIAPELASNHRKRTVCCHPPFDLPTTNAPSRSTRCSS